MQTKTVDSLVRETIQELGLTMHFYVDLLLYSLQELQRLAAHHQMGAKQVKLFINGYNRVKIPSDCMYIIDLSIIDQERILPAVRDRKLNKLYNFDANGNKIKYPDSGSELESSFDVVNFLDDYFLDYNRYGFGGFFGVNTPQDKTFNVDYINKEIVFSNNFEEDEIVLTYASDPVACSSCNLVRYEFWDVIRKHAKAKFMQLDKYYNQYEKEKAEFEYKLAKKNMRSLIYPISQADLIYSTRRGIHAGIKN